MKQTLLMLFVLALGLVGCRDQASSNPADYVGEYVLMPSNSLPPRDFATFMVLKADHEAIEIKFDRDSGQIRNETEKWYLSRGTGQNVVIGKFSCSVEGSRAAVRLRINELGQYYEKVR